MDPVLRRLSHPSSSVLLSWERARPSPRVTRPKRRAKPRRINRIASQPPTLVDVDHTFHAWFTCKAYIHGHLPSRPFCRKWGSIVGLSPPAERRHGACTENGLVANDGGSHEEANVYDTRDPRARLGVGLVVHRPGETARLQQLQRQQLHSLRAASGISFEQLLRQSGGDPGRHGDERAAGYQ